MNSNFLKQEKDRLTNRLISDLSVSNERVPLKKILTGKYPLLFQELAKKEAHKILGKENPIELKANKRFDFEGEKFKTQFSEFKKALLREIFFTAEEIKKFARFSVEFQLDIIVKPRQTILDIIFKKQNEIDKLLAIDIITGFGEERPFIRKLIKTLENENASHCKIDDVIKLSEKIEQNVHKVTPISAFLTDVDLYLNFEISITGDYQTLFPSEILHEMLAKRDLHTISKAIVTEEERDFWTITQIENAFERYLLVGNLEQVQPKKTVKEKTEKKPKASEKQQKREEAEKKQFDFLDGFSKPTQETPVEKEGNAPNGHAEPKEPKPQNGEDQKKDAKRSNGANNQRPKISALISPADKEFLVGAIFDNKADEFSLFIDKLDEIKKWQNARVAINEEIVKRNISPYSKEAILLGDVVFSRYFTAK